MSRTIYSLQQQIINKNGNDDDDASNSQTNNSTTIEFFECCAPFERGCDSVEEFQATQTTIFNACLIPATNAQETMQQFGKSTSAFVMPQEFSHLKRITRPPAPPQSTSGNAETSSSENNNIKKEVLILLGPSSPNLTSNDIQQALAKELSFLQNDDINVKNNIALSSVVVPLFPQTPKEWIFANTVWPLSMPRLQRTVRDTDPSLLSESAKRAACVGFEKILEETKNKDEATMVAVVVNLETGIILASSSRSYSNLEIEKFGGTRKLPYELKPKNCEVKQSDEIRNIASIKSVHEHHVTFDVLRKVSKLQAESNSGYLCNQLALVASHEPCVMCSMALVHSRIAMAFYENGNKVHGGLGGETTEKSHPYFVNRIPSLNHRFPSYRIEKVE